MWVDVVIRGTLAPPPPPPPPPPQDRIVCIWCCGISTSSSDPALSDPRINQTNRSQTTLLTVQPAVSFQPWRTWWGRASAVLMVGRRSWPLILFYQSGPVQSSPVSPLTCHLSPDHLPPLSSSAHWGQSCLHSVQISWRENNYSF